MPPPGAGRVMSIVGIGRSDEVISPKGNQKIELNKKQKNALHGLRELGFSRVFSEQAECTRVFLYFSGPRLMSFSNPNTNVPASLKSESFVVTSQSAANANPTSASSFVERRTLPPTPEMAERRQFGSSHAGLSEAGRELALAMDKYKIENRRRYITCDEMLTVFVSLGYGRN